MDKQVQRNQKVQVSIGMPVYNGEAFICQAIESLLNQTYQDYELIISDNASTDSTLEICLRYQHRDARIKVYRNDTNSGAFKNFRKVLEFASGEYFMWAAHDDVWDSSYLATLVSLLKKRESAVLAFSVFNSIDCNSQEISKYPFISEIPADGLYNRLSNYIDQPERLGKANPIYGLMRILCARLALSSTSKFLEDDVWGSDMLFVFQLLTLGDLVIADQILFHKRVVPPTCSMPEDWNSYFNGYVSLISCNGNLTDAERRNLMNQIEKRRTDYTAGVGTDWSIGPNMELEYKGQAPYEEVLSQPRVVQTDNQSIATFSDKQSSRLSYSQCGEDLIVRFIFDALSIERPTYIDIGAYHPQIISNTALFYYGGSRGINIDANPYLLKDFFEQRIEDINLNIGIGNVSSEIDFYIMSVPTLSTFSKDEVDMYLKETSHTVQNVIPVQVRTITDIIEKYCEGQFPQFLSLDVEGLDLDILKSINYNVSYPLVICVETISFSEKGEGLKNQQIIDFLSRKGYLNYADTYINTIFVKETSWKQQGGQSNQVVSELSLSQSHTTYNSLINQLNTVKLEVDTLRTQIVAMESSKFWKVRQVWFKFKHLLGRVIN